MFPPALIDLLRAHEGEVLTREVSEAILLATLPPVAGVKPADIAPGAHREFLFQAEPVVQASEAFAPLITDFLAETERRQADPDTARYAALERAGKFLFFTVRRATVPVGFCSVMLDAAPMGGETTAYEDGLYLAPDARRGFVAAAFLRYMVAALDQLGVVEIGANATLTAPTNHILPRLGFSHAANQYLRRRPPC